MKPVEAAHRASIKAHAEKHKKAGRATFSIPSILELLSSLEAAEAGVVEARAERDEWKQMVERTDPPRLLETLAELNYQRARAERAEAALARLDIAIDAAAATEEALYNRIVVERARAEKAEARIAEAREVLAAWDINSLPNDMPLLEVCEARIDDLRKFMDRAELAEAVAGREENGRVLAEKRAEDAEARIAGLEAGLKRIADEDYEPIEESFTRAAAAIARALLAERDE